MTENFTLNDFTTIFVVTDSFPQNEIVFYLQFDKFILFYVNKDNRLTKEGLWPPKQQKLSNAFVYKKQLQKAVKTW